MASDNDDAKDDDDYPNNKDVKVVEIGTGQILTMLYRLVNMKYLSREVNNAPVALKFKLEKIRVLRIK